jgi:hypothetical protein
MEKSIGALRTMTAKAEVRTKSCIKNRTQENTGLIKELNKLRLKKRQLENMLEAETLKLQKLALDKTRLSREIHNKKIHSQTNVANYASSNAISGKPTMEGLP